MAKSVEQRLSDVEDQLDDIKDTLVVMNGNLDKINKNNLKWINEATGKLFDEIKKLLKK